MHTAADLAILFLTLGFAEFYAIGLDLQLTLLCYYFKN